jgi:uncharacterized repeat protein (TIGR01451 family)
LTIFTGKKGSSLSRRNWQLAAAGLLLLCSGSAFAAGTPAGTPIQNTATVNFDLAGTPLSLTSNTTTVTVAERIDVMTTLRSAQILVAADDTDRALLFTVTNIGNGPEIFTLGIDSVIAGSDFDPVPSLPDSIYFDTNGDGVFNSVDDTPYVPGSNDPNLAADESVDVFLLNDIPNTVVNGDIGQSELTATSATGTGAPGFEYPGDGEDGTDAIIGPTTGEAADVGEYLVANILIDVFKSELVADQFGGTQPLPGATITYTVTVQVMSAGIATATVFGDPIPTNTTYVDESITFNGGVITDAVDTDEGEINNSGTPTVVVRLGDLDSASGLQTVTFQVTID